MKQNDQQIQITPEFWKHKSLLEMNDAEWEALCDGCGKCCYRKYILGRGKRERLYYTRVACNLLDVETGRCTNYPNRFKIEQDCTKLTKKNLPDFGWLPKLVLIAYFMRASPCLIGTRSFPNNLTPLNKRKF